MRTLAWRLTERWLTRRVPARAIDGVLRDLQDDYRERLGADRDGTKSVPAETPAGARFVPRRIAAVAWLWREARSVAREYRLAEKNVRRTVSESWPSAPARRGMAESVHEIRMAWRGVRARGWRAVFAIGLLGLAMAVNATVFSAADAFVFRTVPYHEPDRLAVLERPNQGDSSDYIWPPPFEAWRQHREIFAGLEAHDFSPNVYVTIGDLTESITSAQVTPGLFPLLGRLPRWGRPFVESDALAGAPAVVLIGESLARRVFGSPERAIGSALATGDGTPTVVGVMPASFRFPTAMHEVWKPLSLATWSENKGLRNIARIAPELTMDQATAAVEAAGPGLLQTLEPRWQRQEVRLRPLVDARRNAGASSVFTVLLGAAACLLLIACANVASLELAAAGRRGRRFAVQAALGASRASLMRVVLFEGAMLLGASAAVSLVLASWGAGVLGGQLPLTMRESLANPLDLDARTMGVMVAVATVTWLLIAVPIAWRVSRLSVVDGLRNDPRVMPVTRGAARVRQALMTGQVALTVLLLVGALLYVQTYAARVGLDKGFDATRIATIQVMPSPDAPVQGAELESRVLQRLRTAPGVLATSRTFALPPSTQGGAVGRLTIDGQEHDERLAIHFAYTDPDYFPTMGIAIVEGSPLLAETPDDEVVIDERFARKYWPSGSPLGARFTIGTVTMDGVHEFRVIGVSRSLRVDEVVRDTGEEVVMVYKKLATFNPLAFVARVESDAVLPAIAEVVRATAERSVVQVDTIEARYARLEGDTRLAAAITGGFAIVALLIATSGVYAVMAYLVSGRRREIGIRMALGADRRSVQAMVLGSAFRFVVAGTLIGLAGAAVAGNWMGSQLFGVTPLDPATYASVAGLVGMTALLATWWPARRAARVDPAVTLRAE